MGRYLLHSLFLHLGAFGKRPGTETLDIPVIASFHPCRVERLHSLIPPGLSANIQVVNSGFIVPLLSCFAFSSKNVSTCSLAEMVDTAAPCSTVRKCAA